MRSLLSAVFALCLAVSVLAIQQVRTAEAAFHCMRIHAVMGGFSGDNNIQYVELRMNAAGQALIGGHTIQFFNSAGSLRATFTFPAGAVSNSNTGESILIATSEFNTNVTGGSADYTFSGANTVGAGGGDPLHPIQTPGGVVVWAPGSGGCTAVVPVDSTAYGGAPATFGTAAVALPSTTQALRLSNLALTPSNNSTEYSLQNVATSTFAVAPANLATDFTTPRKNNRTVLRLNGPAAVGGVAEQPVLAAEPAVASPGGAGDGLRNEVLAGLAAAAVACSAGWFVYRRRTQS